MYMDFLFERFKRAFGEGFRGCEISGSIHFTALNTFRRMIARLDSIVTDFDPRDHI
jgi:hypothetical protein